MGPIAFRLVEAYVCVAGHLVSPLICCLDVCEVKKEEHAKAVT